MRSEESTAGVAANHRVRLEDGVVIKDSHLQLVGDLRRV